MKTESKVGVAIVIAVMWTAVSVVVWPSLATRFRLRGRMAVCQGYVVRLDPGDHNRATYQYTVASRVFENSEIASHRKAGDLVRVYFDPDEPKVAMLSEPGAGLWSDVRGVILLYLFVAAAALWLGAYADRNRTD